MVTYRTFCVVLLLLLSLLFSSRMLASDFPIRWYEVELIVFSHITKNALNSEQWPLVNPASLNTKNAKLLDATELKPKQELAMNREQRLLVKAGYKPVLHIAWKQQIFKSGEGELIPIHVYGGNAYSATGAVLTNDIYETSPYQSQNQASWQLDGVISLSLNRYFNFHCDLFFAAPITKLKKVGETHYFNNVAGKLAYFRLLASRRMRSNELNYIAYPLYGILVKITGV